MAKKTRLFRTQFDPSYKGSPGEVNKNPSLTVPDQTISIQKLLKNHTRGIPSDVRMRHPHYFETEIKRYDDLIDQLEHKQQIAEDLKQAKLDAKKELIEKREAALEALAAKKALEEQKKASEKSDES